MALSPHPTADRVRVESPPASRASSDSLHRSELASVRSQLGREFADLPPSRLNVVFEACVASLDTGMWQARPELVYRLAHHRLSDGTQ